MDYRKEISKLIKKTRAEKGLTQAAFAEELSIGLPRSITKQYISQWENGKKIPSIWLMYSVYRGLYEIKQTWIKLMANQIIKLLQESDNEKKRKRKLFSKQQYTYSETELSPRQNSDVRSS